MRSVEFLGIPGSGKTTLAANVHSRLGAANTPAFTLAGAVSRGMKNGVGDRLIDPVMTHLPERLLNRYSESGFIRSNALLVSLIDFMAAYPMAVSAFLRGQARRADYELGTNLVIRWFLQLVARYQLAASAVSEDDLLLLDEGFGQRAITGFAHRFSEADHDDLSSYLSASPRPDLLVHLAVGTDLAAERLAGRGEPEATKRLWGTDTDPARFLADTSDCVAYTAEAARAADWDLMEVDGSADLAAQTSAVIARIDALTANETGPPQGEVPSLDLPVEG